MSYIEDSLSKGEKVQTLFKLHWFTKIPMALWIILAIATFPYIYGAPLLLVFWEVLKYKSIEQGVTSKRVILKTGIISRNSDEMKVSSIETVEINQNILGRIFGFGTVSVTGKGISDLVFKNIDDPMSVKKAIESVEVVPSADEVQD